MLQHEADGWRFTPEDVIALVARTQLTEKQVKDWESSTHRRRADTIKSWLEKKSTEEVLTYKFEKMLYYRKTFQKYKIF